MLEVKPMDFMFIAPKLSFRRSPSDLFVVAVHFGMYHKKRHHAPGAWKSLAMTGSMGTIGPLFLRCTADIFFSSAAC